MATLLNACPGFSETWRQYLKRWGGAERGLYIDLAQIGAYVVESYSRGDTREFPALFEAVEQLLAYGNDEVREAVSVGLLEDIQNVASHEAFGARVFERWLGPLARAAWTAGQRGWEGKPSLVSVLRAETGQPSQPELIPDIGKVENQELAALLRGMYRMPSITKKRPWWKFW